MKYDVFLSYSRSDSDFAQSLADKLRHVGVSVWYDREKLEWGDSLIDATQNALKSASVVLMLISKHYNDSNWTAFARGAAHAMNKGIIPVAMEDNIEIPSDLSEASVLNAKTIDEDKIVKKIQELLEK